MLKLVLALASDWNAYRRMMRWDRPAKPGQLAGLLKQWGEVSIWPVEAATLPR